MNFSPSSRTWIYMSSRQLSDQEVNDMNIKLQNFCSVWAAHGNNLKAKGEVLYHRFVVLMVDETVAGASGCSIDSSVHFIQQLEREFKTELFNRMLFAYRSNNAINVVHLNELPDLIGRGIINEGTMIFNIAITVKSELDSAFELPLSQSWLMKRASRFFHPSS